MNKVSSSNKTMCVIDLRQGFIMRMPVKTGAELPTRDDAVFSMEDVDGALTIIGTYDQFLDFAADIGQKAMSWTIVTGNTDWLGKEIQAAAEGDTSSERRENGHGSPE